MFILYFCERILTYIYMELKTRQLEIIEAAGRLLTKGGVNSLTIKNIAKEMNFSEGAVYRHFQSKEEIIVALLRYLGAIIDDRLNAIPQTDNAEQNMKNLFFEQFLFFSQHQHFVVAVFSDGLIEESKAVNEAIFSLIAIMEKHLTNIITEGQATACFNPDIPASQLVQIVLGTYKLQMFKWRLSGFSFDIHAEGSSIMSSLLLLVKS
ncbi:MAG: TetR/AcrR family transcriptional regulator [Paludibacter sp.]|jgi:TetR/AcrR family fatty acid metabolism transcriptional regulator|nr:TetR/AcrR family transcriptional regulator [Paludibacter sp.]